MTSKRNLRGLIADYGTYEELGKEIGVTRQAISNVVNGRSQSVPLKYSIAAALGRSVDDIEWPEPSSAVA